MPSGQNKLIAERSPECPKRTLASEVQSHYHSDLPEIDYAPWRKESQTGAGLRAPVGSELVVYGGWIDGPRAPEHPQGWSIRRNSQDRLFLVVTFSEARANQMEIFFADDSIQQTPRREGLGVLVGVGGVLVTEEAVRPVAAAIDSIAEAFGIPMSEEFKWSPKRGTWIRDNLRESRAECYAQILEAAHTHSVRAIVICNDTRRTGDTKDGAYQRCLDYLFERLSMNLETRDAQAIMVADRPGGGKIQEDEFLAYFLRRVREGTSYVPPKRLLLNVLTTPSQMIRQLQLADLVTGITTAMVAGLDTYAGPLFPLVRRLLITNRPGGIAGTGLKIAPDSTRGDSLVNLYHWVLGENFLHKGGGATAYRLPASGYPFENDGGVTPCR